jgi:hypothetical protein
LEFGQTDTLIFSTMLYEGNQPPPLQWWYYSFETGQHISFFQRRTLAVLADKLGSNFCSNGWLHLISKRKISEAVLKALTGRLSGVLLSRIRRRLPSRTASDHSTLVGRLKRNSG